MRQDGRGLSPTVVGCRPLLVLNAAATRRSGFGASGFLYCRYRYLMGRDGPAAGGAEARSPEVEYATPLAESIYTVKPPYFPGPDRSTGELGQTTRLGQPGRNAARAIRTVLDLAAIPPS